MTWSIFFAVLAFAAGYRLGLRLRVGITGITREDEDDLRGII